MRVFDIFVIPKENETHVRQTVRFHHNLHDSFIRLHHYQTR
jgi:hypothetical protein